MCILLTVLPSCLQQLMAGVTLSVADIDERAFNLLDIEGRGYIDLDQLKAHLKGAAVNCSVCVHLSEIEMN